MPEDPRDAYDQELRDRQMARLFEQEFHRSRVRRTGRLVAWLIVIFFAFSAMALFSVLTYPSGPSCSAAKTQAAYNACFFAQP